MVVATFIDDPWLAEVMRAAAFAGALFAVLSVGIRMFGDTQILKLLKTIKEDQDKMSTKIDTTNRLLEAIAKALGAKVPPPDADVDNDDNNDNDNDNDNDNGGGDKPDTGDG